MTENKTKNSAADRIASGTLFPDPARIVPWFREKRKLLPWRMEPTPYHVWISEVMLQQTRIEAVIPYYRRFLDEFPDPAALAAADDGKLMKAWEGLGYYSRARNLKKAAAVITERYGGELPADAALLRTLPGIGDYTAGAVASIAFGLPEPAVDGNVLRVCMRHIASSADVLAPKTKRDTAAELKKIYPSGEEAALFTEGLMELGETVCVPSGEPKCEVCPLRDTCRARAMNRTADFPVRAEARPRTKKEYTVLAVCRGDRYAIRRREDRGLLAGMWELPNLEGKKTAAEVRETLAAAGLAVLSVEPLGEAVHVFTHVEWHMTGYRVTAADADRTGPDGWVWKTPADIRKEHAVPTAFRAYMKQI